MTFAQRRARGRPSGEQSRERIVAAATALIGRPSHAELTVSAVMREAGIARTVFYLHFEDLAQLLVHASREAVAALDAAQIALERIVGDEPDHVRQALAPAVEVYQRHGPLLQAVADAEVHDAAIASERMGLRARLDELAARSLLRGTTQAGAHGCDSGERARALSRMNEGYLLDVFGRRPRVSAETALQTLTEIWVAVIAAGPADH